MKVLRFKCVSCVVVVIWTFLNVTVSCTVGGQKSKLRKRSVADCVWNVMSYAQKPDFVFQQNRRVYLNWPGVGGVGRQFSRLLAAEVCASVVVILGYTMFWGSVKNTGYPFHLPVSPFTSLPVHHLVPSHFSWSLPETLRRSVMYNWFSFIHTSLQAFKGFHLSAWQKSNYLCICGYSCMNCQIIILRRLSSCCFTWRRWWNTVQQTRWRHATLLSSLVLRLCAQQMTTWSPWLLTWHISARLLSCSSPM